MANDKDLLITKYLSGNTNQEEERILKQWIEESPLHLSEFNKAKELWDVSNKIKQEPEENTENAWQEFLSLRDQPVKKGVPASARRSYILKIAAALTILLGITLILRFAVFTSDKQNPELSEVKQPAAVSLPPVPEEIEMIRISSGDSVELFLLPDSSRVYLNKYSTIEYPKDFLAQRKVFLRGEGFFEVEHIDSSAFYVICNTVHTRVVGTSFSVKSEAEDGKVEVNVLTGVVEVTDTKKPASPVLLQQNEKVVFNPQTETFSKGKSSSKDFKWREKSKLGNKIKKFINKLRNKIK